VNVVVREMDRETLHRLKIGGSSFEVRSKLVLHAEHDRIHYTIVDVPPYTKQYGAEHVEPATYLDNPERIVFFADLEGALAGQVRILRNWNGYAYIDDIAVEPAYRGRGVGRALMERAIEWAKANGFPGMMLETQNNNVRACKFYERCGFVLCGFDTHLYKALDPDTDEIALYWYLMFRETTPVG
jgi:ribosomal protein S18 acetylase RimI-like enzyme